MLKIHSAINYQKVISTCLTLKRSISQNVNQSELEHRMEYVQSVKSITRKPSRMDLINIYILDIQVVTSLGVIYIRQKWILIVKKTSFHCHVVDGSVLDEYFIPWSERCVEHSHSHLFTAWERCHLFCVSDQPSVHWADRSTIQPICPFTAQVSPNYPKLLASSSMRS